MPASWHARGGSGGMNEIAEMVSTRALPEVVRAIQRGIVDRYRLGGRNVWPPCRGR